MSSKCSKVCECDCCEFFMGSEDMRVFFKNDNPFVDPVSYKVRGVACGSGYRVAIDFDDLKNGYEESDYEIVPASDGDLLLQLKDN